MAKLVAISILILGILTHIPSASATGCRPVNNDDQAFYPLPMTMAVAGVSEDPRHIWTSGALWNPNTPARTSIWQASVFPCEGELIVSQIVNRQCSSATVCPARVMLLTQSGNQTLLDYKQICTIHERFELRGDGRQLRACGQAFDLEQVSPPLSAAKGP